MSDNRKNMRLRLHFLAITVALTFCLAGVVAGDAEEKADVGKVLLCLGFSGQAGPSTPEGAAFEELAALVLSLPVKAKFEYLAPAFQNQSEEFWRGFMIAMFTDNAVRFSKEEAQRFFAERNCDELVE